MNLLVTIASSPMLCSEKSHSILSKKNEKKKPCYRGI
jgi:hypothetical protein